MSSYQLSNTDLCLHQARMLHIKGEVEQSIAVYKHILQGLLKNATDYPQYKDYFQSYFNMILEEAEAIKKEEEKKKTQPAPEPIHFYIPVDEPEPVKPVKPVKPVIPAETYETPYYSPPLPTAPKPSLARESSNPTSLTNSDIRYAAAGVINGIQNFDHQYNVSNTCINAYNACSNKAKELNDKYEISKKAQNLGYQIKEWDERNGVSKAVMNGIKKAAKTVEGAVKDYAEKSRNNPEINRDYRNPY